MIPLRASRPPHQVVTLDQPSVKVTVRRMARAKRMTLRIAAGSGLVSMTVPQRTSDRDISRFLEQHRGWLAQRHAALPAPIVPAPGLTLQVNGHSVTLEKGTGRRALATPEGLSLPGTSEERFISYLRAWLMEQARQACLMACDHYASALGQRYARLSLRDPRSRWGSCTSTGNIMLSWRLVLAPPAVLRYVAAHEIAHLVEMNHSQAFWAAVADLMPDYADHQTWLRVNGAQLHRYQL